MASIDEIQIRLFGAFRDCAANSVFFLPVEGARTVSDIKSALGKKLAANSKLTFDAEALVAKSVLATDERILDEGETVTARELSILPPVCGG